MKTTTIAAVTVLLSAGGVSASSLMPVVPHTISSPSGACLARIEPATQPGGPDPHPCLVVIHALDAATGEYRRTKEVALEAAIYFDAMIGDDGRYLVTFDTHSRGQADAIVIYDLVAGSETHLKLEDFLPPALMAERAESMGDRDPPWHGEAGFTSTQDKLHIFPPPQTLAEGKPLPSFILDLATRTVAIEPAPEPDPRMTQRQNAEGSSLPPWFALGCLGAGLCVGLPGGWAVGRAGQRQQV